MTSLLDILEAKNIKYKKTNNPAEILIKCTNPDHSDNDPSLSFNIEKNLFKCWSCGFAGGLQKFLQSIGITTKIHIQNKQEYKIKKLKDKLQHIKEGDEIRMPFNIEPCQGPFKDIPLAILKEFKAFKTVEYGLEDYICIPVYQFGKLRFIEGRHRMRDPSQKPKYMRCPMGVSVSKIVFPLDKVKSNHIILVEGMFDMLNMWRHGYHNTLCIFGTSNFGIEKAKILDRVGVTSATVLMDGDEPGYRAASVIARFLDSRSIAPNVIRLDAGKDPGVLTREELNNLIPKDKN